MSLFPMFAKLGGRRAVVVGGGRVGEPKIKSLLIARANVRVVAPRVTAAVQGWAAAGVLAWEPREFLAEDLDETFLVIAATSSASVNAQVHRAASERGVLCNSVDDPEHCDFYYGSVVRRGQLQIAISTEGKSPALAQRLRKEFEAKIGPEHAGWVAELGKKRDALFASEMEPEERRLALHALASRDGFMSWSNARRRDSDLDSRASKQRNQTPAHKSVRATHANETAKGKVWLVGAGPGDPELLTCKALRLLEEADVVLHDDLVSAEILALIPGGTRRENIGKRCGKKDIGQEEINALLVTFAKFGLKVVRLKSGDPMIFGRAGEEMEAMRRAGVDFEIVPGVTSALGAAASAQVSLTHRKVASAVAFLTSHQAKNAAPADWEAWVRAQATLVIYMPGYEYAEIVSRLTKARMPAETPCAVVSRATRDDEQILRTTLRDLPGAQRLEAPTLLFVGDVVGIGQGVEAVADFEWLAARPALAELIAEIEVGGL